MLQKELLRHQWQSFRRNPMFQRNLGIRIFMFVMLGMLALELLMFGFFLDKALLQLGTYERAIDIFNSLLLYVFAADFAIKFFFKQSRSMKIAPYLGLPIKRNKLFDFLLNKEFGSFWNLYLLFLVVPFAFKAVTPNFGLGAAFLYILFFWLLCNANSLIVNIINNLINKSVLYYIPAAIWVVFPFAVPLLTGMDIGQYTQKSGDLLLNYNLWIWAGFLLVFVALRTVNRLQMRQEVYRDMQGEKMEKISSFSSLSFLERFGETGALINLDLKMIFRAKRLKQSFYSVVFLLVYFFWQVYSSHSIFEYSFFSKLFFGIFVLSGMGLIMGQYLFMTESAHFDGLMSRKLSLFNLLRGKYILYSSYSVVMALLMLIPVFSEKLSLLYVVAGLFFVIGPIYFLIFQNAVYNKTYFNLFEGGMMNWKGTSSSMMFISLSTMFVPIIILLIINGLFGENVVYWFMLSVGMGFTFGSRYWLKWTYNRFLKRKYSNMEGYRSNA